MGHACSSALEKGILSERREVHIPSMKVLIEISYRTSTTAPLKNSLSLCQWASIREVYKASRRQIIICPEVTARDTHSSADTHNPQVYWEYPQWNCERECNVLLVTAEKFNEGPGAREVKIRYERDTEYSEAQATLNIDASRTDTIY